MRRRLGWLALALGLLLPTLHHVVAQEPPEVPPVPKVVAPDKPRDPTEPSGKLKDRLDASKAITTTTGAPLPMPVLRGRVMAKDKPPVAILELDGKTIVVRPNSRIPLTERVGLRVIAINAAEVKLELEPSKETIVLE